jgi:uroporphyrinogen decarboxylase
MFHIGYKGRDVFLTNLLVKEFGKKATLMGSVDTKLLINPKPKVVYDQAATSIIAGRDAPRGYILGCACECPMYTLSGNILAMIRAAKDHGTYGTW